MNRGRRICETYRIVCGAFFGLILAADAYLVAVYSAIGAHFYKMIDMPKMSVPMKTALFGLLIIFSLSGGLYGAIRTIKNRSFPLKMLSAAFGFTVGVAALMILGIIVDEYKLYRLISPTGWRVVVYFIMMSAWILGSFGILNFFRMLGPIGGFIYSILGALGTGWLAGATLYFSISDLLTLDGKIVYILSDYIPRLGILAGMIIGGSAFFVSKDRTGQ